MINRIVTYIKDLFTDPLGVGQTVFWDNPVDYRFREYYLVSRKVDERGLVGIYNEEKGERFAHRHELVPINQMTDAMKDEMKRRKKYPI